MIAATLKDWMTNTVLPFWANEGVDAATGAFQERFTPDGRPDLSAPRRLRVQARQIYVFSHASVLGWREDGAQVALRAFDRLMATAWGGEAKPGFAQSLNIDGSVHNPLRDSYDHAFVVLALAWLLKATGAARVESALTRTLAFIDTSLTDSNRSLFEDDRRSLPRRQNPQMHWFEAVLALVALDYPNSRPRAARSLSLFRERLFDRTTGMLGEYYDDRWMPAAGSDGTAVEPGHLAEWSWLLRQCAPLLGENTQGAADLLLRTALSHRSSQTGLLWDEIARDGSLRLASSRSWPMTELAKACLAKAETGDLAARALAEDALQRLDQYFLRKPFEAGWLDRVNETGQPFGLMVSGSTLYHIFVAISEADRVLNSGLVSDKGREDEQG